MRRLASIAAAILHSSATLAGCATEPSSGVHEVTPYRSDVRQIVEEIAALPPERASGPRQQALFDQLIAMGPEAVPTLVALMDDRRPLAWSGISLENRAPDAFEAVRHYGPVLMVDALAAVLNQITGEQFGFIYNGATEAQRAATVAGWKERYGLPPLDRGEEAAR